MMIIHLAGKPLTTCTFQKHDCNEKMLTGGRTIIPISSALRTRNRRRYSRACLGYFFLFRCSLREAKEQLPPCLMQVQFVFSTSLFSQQFHHILPSIVWHFSLSAWKPCMPFSCTCESQLLIEVSWHISPQSCWKVLHHNFHIAKIISTGNVQYK